MALKDAVLRYSPCSRSNPPTLSSSGAKPATSTTSAPPPASTYTPQPVRPSELAQAREEFSGKVVGVTDGDTIKVLCDGREVTIRLNAIDCPESSQAFGQHAKEFTSDQCYMSQVPVRVFDTDKYGRLVGDVILPSGLVLNQTLIMAGMAWHYVEYSKDEFLAELERRARGSRVGLWADASPVPPWEYRR
jgi:micrococcal nuclease